MTIYDRIRDLRKERGMSQGDLAEAVGYSGKSAISKVEKGERDISQSMIEKYAKALGVSPVYLLFGDDDTAPSLPADILPPPSTHRVPILGTIACGTPIEAVENYEGEAFVPEDVSCDFALRCKGDSMTGARINDGDLVYIRSQPQVESGQIAAVLIDGEATLKRVYYHTNSVVLMPANPAYDPIVLDPATTDPDSVRVLGLAVAFTSVIV